MGKYLKLFTNHAAYDAVKNNLDKPNVSYCLQENEVHYNPWKETRLIVIYNVTNASNSTLLYGYYAEEGEEEYWVKGVDIFTKVEIDGTEVSIQDLDTAQGQYQLSNGEHTVKYTLKDPTLIGNEETQGKVGATFSDCSNLTSVIIPDSVISIGEFAFDGCSGLTSVTIPNSVTFIGNGAFDHCTGLTSVTIPNSVTTIGRSAFYCCNSLTSITLPDSLTNIEYSAFRLTGLTSITIPNSVTSIGDFVFNTCSNLTSVTIGNSVTSIGKSTFSSCHNLDSIICNATTAPTISSNTFQNIKTGGTLTVPANSTGYNVWMGTGDYYLGKYNWTKVEQ